MIKKSIAIILLIICSSQLVYAHSIESCFKKASQKHDVPLHYLLAVSYTESRFKGNLSHRNKNGTHDYGLMQINSIWSNPAKKMGYNWNKIKTNSCTNIMFGSHILKLNFKRLGSWQSAIGAYNAGFSKTKKAQKRRQRYFNLVMKHRLIAKRTFKKIKHHSS